MPKTTFQNIKMNVPEGPRRPRNAMTEKGARRAGKVAHQPARSKCTWTSKRTFVRAGADKRATTRPLNEPGLYSYNTPQCGLRLRKNPETIPDPYVSIYFSSFTHAQTQRYLNTFAHALLLTGLPIMTCLFASSISTTAYRSRRLMQKAKKASHTMDDNIERSDPWISGLY